MMEQRLVYEATGERMGGMTYTRAMMTLNELARDIAFARMSPHARRCVEMAEEKEDM